MPEVTWHDLRKDPDDLPDFGERVIICIGNGMVGEGYLKKKGEWWRYCDLGPVDQYMRDSVTAWAHFPEPLTKNKLKPKLHDCGPVIIWTK